MAHRLRRRLATAALAVIAAGPALADGGDLFAANCQVCHFGEVSGPELPSMDPAFILGPTDDVILRILLGSEAKADAFSFDVNGMPGFMRKFDDAEAADLINYLRDRFGSEDAQAVTAPGVARVRAEWLAQ